ncbi:MAG: tetratricopeptide repeat protein [Bacteroidota bacterium]
MSIRTIRQTNCYSQGQQSAASILLTVWLLASGNPDTTLAAPDHQRAMVSGTVTSFLGQPAPRALALAQASGPAMGTALTPFIQRAPRLLSRALDKLASRFLEPSPTQYRTLQPEPVAEGTEGGSYSLVATSHTAIPALQQLMSQPAIPDNQTLVEALNTAPPQEQHRWLAAAVRWFDTQSVVTLPPAALQDYAALAHLQVTPENSKLLKQYFNSLCNKVRAGAYGEERAIQALAYSLEHLDPAVFAGDPQPLLDLGYNLLSKLSPSQREFKQADYPSAHASLEALLQTLFLAKEVAPGHLNVRDGGLYQSFRQQLKAIAYRAQYYPVIYYAQLLKQTLRLLEDPQIDLEGNLRRLGQGLQGMAALYQGGRGLLTLELKVNKLAEGFRLLREAAHNQRSHQHLWYDQLLTLQGNALQCLQEQRPQPYPSPAALEQKVETISWQRIGLQRIIPGKVRQYQQALRFGIAMQLQMLALQGTTPTLRTGSIERLIALAQPTAWGADPHAIVGLLDTLALVAVQSQTARAAEAAMAREALEAIARALPAAPSQHPLRLDWLFQWLQSPQDTAAKALSQWLAGKTLPSKLQQLREQTTQQTPDQREHLFRHVKRTLKRDATIESYRAQEIKNLPQLASYIALSKLNHFVERSHITKQLAATLQEQGVCVLHGFGGVGKSTLAAHYGHERKNVQAVRWIPAEDSSKLQARYEQLAQELEVDYQPLAKKLTADPRQYRQELAKIVYNALARNNQPTLLILDNAEDASLIADYLMHRTSTVQAIITTRNADAFAGTYKQLQVNAFSQAEGRSYLQVRLGQIERRYTDHEVEELLTEVGLVPKKLGLATGYLEANKLVGIAEYIARLRSLKQSGNKQQGQLFLPEVSLGLEKLTKESQQLMQYGAYLDADFIPRSLVSALLEEDDTEQLSEMVADLSKLSLMQVVSDGAGELGLQIHREVQASCREYQDWSSEAALGPSGAILAQLAQVLASQMPWVSSNPDKRWQQARLYAPHVAKVVSRLRSSGTEPSAVVARLLNCMGQYSKEVARNYPEALEYQKQALQICQDHYKEDHPDVARALSEIGTTLSQLGKRPEALEYKQQALAMRQRLLQGKEDPDLAHSLNSVGELLSHLGKHPEALKYKQKGLAMRQRLFKDADHPDIARSLNSVGISWEDLGNLSKALSYKRKGLEMRQRLSSNQYHQDIAHSLNNVGETLIKLGQAEEGLDHCKQGWAMRERLFKGQDHPYMAQSLNGVGMAYTALARYQEAATHYQQATEMALRVFKQAHPQLTKYLHHLTETFPKLEATQVQQIKTALVPLCIEVLGEEHAQTKDLLAASEASDADPSPARSCCGCL